MPVVAQPGGTTIGGTTIGGTTIGGPPLAGSWVGGASERNMEGLKSDTGTEKVELRVSRAQEVRSAKDKFSWRLGRMLQLCSGQVPGQLGAGYCLTVYSGLSIVTILERFIW